mmetsp:Transcript_15738/g.35712  ORF Transcript_15738/g.35712 Transcript_15738/m.35712 type:complete len:220 (-) Transcript_15738:3104-3763(-)
MRRVLLGQDEVTEGDRKSCFGTEPAVGDDTNEVLGRQRIEDGDREGERVVVFSEFRFEDEQLVVENVFLVDVFDNDVEWFGCAVHLGLELEVRRDRKLHTKYRARDWLHMGRQVEFWKLVNKSVDELPHLREAHELTDFLGLKVVKTFPRKIFLFNFFDDILRDAFELTKRRLRKPHPPIDHLAKIQYTVSECCPTAFEHDLVQATHQARGGLRYVHHV